MQRRSFLLSTAAFVAVTSREATSYYQIDLLMAPQLIVVYFSVISSDIGLVRLGPGADARSKLIEHITSRLAIERIAIPVSDSTIYSNMPQDIATQNILEVRLRVDLQSGRTTDEQPTVQGAASMLFQRGSGTHLSAVPFTLFTAKPEQPDVSAKCVEAAVVQIDSALLPQLIAEGK